MVSLPGRDRAQRAVAAGGNADGVLNLLPRQVQRAAGDDGRNKRSQRSVMPSPLANAGKRRFAKAHLELMAQDQTDNQFLAAAAGPLAARQRRGENIGRMRGVLLPINVVVIHAADHQRVGQRRRDRIDPLARADHRGSTTSCYLAENFQSDLHVVLLIAAERAADGIEQETLRLVDRVLREISYCRLSGPAGHFGGDRFFRCGNRFRCGQGIPP